MNDERENKFVAFLFNVASFLFNVAVSTETITEMKELVGLEFTVETEILGEKKL
jgi:hypothetical protein